MIDNVYITNTPTGREGTADCEVGHGTGRVQEQGPSYLKKCNDNEDKY